MLLPILLNCRTHEKNYISFILLENGQKIYIFFVVSNDIKLNRIIPSNEEH